MRTGRNSTSTAEVIRGFSPNERPLLRSPRQFDRSSGAEMRLCAGLTRFKSGRNPPLFEPFRERVPYWAALYLI